MARPRPMFDTRRGERGAIIPLTIIFLAVLMLATALTVDVGMTAATNRDLQSVADLAASDAARTMDGRPTSLQEADVRAAAVASAERNGFTVEAATLLEVDLGNLQPDGTFVPTGPTEVPTAVRVEAGESLDYLFVPGSRDLDREAIASRETFGGLSIGSYLASIDTASIPFVNEIFSQQLGGNIDLDLVSHQGLANAEVTLQELAVAAGVGSVDELLSTDLTAVQFFDLTANAMNTRGDSAALAALPGLGVLSAATTTAGTFQLGDVLGVEAGDGRSVGEIEFGVGDLVRGTAALISDGTLLKFDLPVTVPGVVDGSIRMSIIEGEQSAVGPPRNGAIPGPTVTNSQVRLHMNIEVLNTGFTQPLRLPIFIDVGTGRAELIGISCGSDGLASQAQTAVSTTAGTVRFGDISDADLLDPTKVPSPARIFSLPGFLGPLLTIDASGSTSIGGSNSEIPFSPVFDQNNTQDVGGAGLNSGLLNSNLVLTPTILGLNLGLLNGVVSLVTSLLGDVLDVLSPVLDSLLQATGIRIGGAEVTVFAADCQAPALVR